MILHADAADMQFGPWNPGIRSPVPEPLRQFCTIFLPENVFTSFSKAAELRDLTGLEMNELTAFRPRRLILHELLIRVTADLSVPDGEKIEDLGINFREMTRVILARYLGPHVDSITASFDAARQQLARFIEAELTVLMPTGKRASAAEISPAKSGLFALFTRNVKKSAPAKAASGWDDHLISAWLAKALATDDGLEKSAYRALARVTAAMLKRHGRPWGTRELIASIAMDVASNEWGSDVVGRAIEPVLLQAAQREGYSLLPAQEWPVIMNTKGPSASGKSTLRPRQKQLAGSIGVKWSDFALISPDIWRKQLLDYATLGANYKYAGSFTGDELQIVDQKLDRYMARKAERGQTSHLLIDRFRFDSFASDSDEAGSNLLTRFGRIIYLFFMITPPGLLVERAWNRGLDVGRYKAVDDTLAHGVEAYSGMPQLFFTWVRRADKRVHFEFLDNSVKRGARPRTVAFGGNETLNVLDIKCMLDIERYRRANIHATAPDLLYTDTALSAAENNLGFLKQCIARFRDVNFADQNTGRIYLSMASGSAVWTDREALEKAILSTDARAALVATAASVFDRAVPMSEAPRFLKATDAGRPIPTVGRWGAGD
jgi:hypothetical protein